MFDLLPELCDHYPEQVQLLPPSFQHYGNKPLFWGEVVTVKCYEDNSKVKQLLAQPGKGKVLVVDGAGSLNRALMGDLIAASAVDNLWQGVVIFGAIRDVAAINQMDLGVRALAACPMKTERKGVGEQDVEIYLEGVRLRSGMHLYADPNGILVSEKALDVSKFV